MSTTAPQLTHACNAYCRDGEHAHVVWVNHLHGETAEALLARWCDELGLAYVAAVPAPEARPTAGLTSRFYGEGDVEIVRAAPRGTPYLVRFRTA